MTARAGSVANTGANPTAVYLPSTIHHPVRINVTARELDYHVKAPKKEALALRQGEE
jgi:hypothetical protein